MNDHLAILKELNLPLYIPRDPEKPKLACVIFVAESEAEFSESHHTQLKKILDFLGFKANDYLLCFKDSAFPENEINLLLSFGAHSLQAARIISTHSISAMLQNPECKREVLHVIQPIRRKS